MSAQASEQEIESDGDYDSLEAAYEAVADALGHLDMMEHTEQWLDLQQRYFDLKAAMLARDGEFQDVDLSGTRVTVPTVRRPVDEETVEDEHGEWEIPTRHDSFRVLDSVEVCKPNNAHTTHHISVDHVVEPDSVEVRLEINASTIDEIVDEIQG